MSKKLSKERASLCTFTFADGRRCATPRAGKKSHFCYFHAQKDRQRLDSLKVAHQVTKGLSPANISACSLNATLGQLFAAVAVGRMDPKIANTLAYLAQTMAQTLPLADREFSFAFGQQNWREAVIECFRPLSPKYVDSYLKLLDEAQSRRNSAANSNPEPDSDRDSGSDDLPV